MGGSRIAFAEQTTRRRGSEGERVFAWLVSAVLIAVHVVALGLIVRRLLGAPVSFVRCLITGLVGFFIAFPAIFVGLDGSGLVDSERMARGDVTSGELLIMGVSMLWVLALGAAFLAGLEFLWPSYRSVGVIARVKGGRDRSRRVHRYIEIIRTAMRHGLGPLLRGRAMGMDELGPALVAALSEAGVTFVKLGQMLSSRADIIPPVLAEHLSGLQTRVSPMSWGRVEAVLAHEFGAPPTHAFRSIEQVPLGSASIGQVHAATLLTGEEVVVKVQRPGARVQVETDIDIALRICRRLEWRSAAVRRIHAHRLMSELAASLRAELDYRIEAQNLSLMRASVARGPSGLVVPQLIADRTTKRVLTMTRVHAEPLTSASEILVVLSGEQRRSLAEKVVDSVLHQVLVDGVFHADLHAGNIMLGKDGTVGLIDFGSIAVIDREQRELLTAFLTAFRAEDPRSAAVAIRHLVARGDQYDDEELRRDVGELFTISAIERDTKVLTERLLRLFHRHGLAVPGNLAAAVRTLATLQDALARIDPSIDYAELLLSRVGRVTARQMDHTRLALQATAHSLTVMSYLRRLPDNIDAITQAHAARSTSSRLMQRQRRRLQLRVISALGGCAFSVCLGAAALVLMLDGGGVVLQPGVPVLSVVGAAVGAAAVVVGTRSVIVVRGLIADPS